MDYLDLKFVAIWDRRPPENWDKNIIDWYESLLEMIDKYSDGGTILVGEYILLILECTSAFSSNRSPSYDVYPAPERPIGYLKSMLSGKEKKWEIFVEKQYIRNKIEITQLDGSKQEIVVDHLYDRRKIF